MLLEQPAFVLSVFTDVLLQFDLLGASGFGDAWPFEIRNNPAAFGGTDCRWLDIVV